MYNKNISENNGENKEINKEVAAIYRRRTPYRGSIRRGRGTYNNIIQNHDNTEIQGIQKVNLNVLIVESMVIWLEHAKVKTHTKYHTVETNTVQAENAVKVESSTRNKRASTPYNKRSSEYDEDNNKYTSLNEIRSPLERTARKTTAAVNEPGREGNQLLLAGKI